MKSGLIAAGLAATGLIERAAFMPMTDLKAHPTALKPAYNNNGLSQGMCGSAFFHFSESQT